MIRLLQRQGFIEHKPTSASEAAHQQRLLPVGYQFKLVSLQALHDGSLYCVLHHDAIGHVYPGPEVTINVPAARKRSFLILRTRFARGGEFAIKVPTACEPLILLLFTIPENEPPVHGPRCGGHRVRHPYTPCIVAIGRRFLRYNQNPSILKL